MYFDYFLIAVKNILLPTSLFSITVGVFIGIIVGALPGLSTQMAVAILLPITFGLDPRIGLPMLMAIYCGGMFGGSVSAILFHTPGTPAAAATCLDGYPMSQKGFSGKAIGFALSASFIGGIISVFLLFLIAPALAKIALLFGPPEYFSLAVLGLSLIGILAQKSWLKGLLSAVIGLNIALVGSDIITGDPRFIFGNIELLTGINLVIVVIGLFSISQTFIMIEESKELNKVQRKDFLVKILPNFSELWKLKRTILKSSLIGTFVGMIPGTGGDLASWTAYNEAKRSSKNPELFGSGIPEGIVASEAANNAVTGGALIPLLTLGIPGSAVTAILLGGFFIHGLRPGPNFLIQNGDIGFTLILSLFVANLVMLFMGVFVGKMSIYFTNVKNEIIAPFIIILSIIGSYAINNSMFDVGLMFIFGIFGYFIRIIGIPIAPLVLGVILSPIAERGFIQSLLISGGNWLIFVKRPLSLIFLSLSFFILMSAIFKDLKSKSK